MRRRFFVDQVRSGRAEISGDDARHLTRVLRVEAGQRYEISDNHNVYLAEIDTARKEHVTFRTIEKLAAPAPTVRLVLCAALIKFDHFEWMIEKATELGVSEIVPVETIRSERGLERAAHKRVERWRRIAREAAQQSRRSQVPQIDDPQTLKQFLTMSPRDEKRIVLAESERVTMLQDCLDGSDAQVQIAIGPEGGWAEEELSLFHEKGWQAASLGPRILRAETAAIASIAIATARLENS